MARLGAPPFFAQQVNDVNQKEEKTMFTPQNAPRTLLLGLCAAVTLTAIGCTPPFTFGEPIDSTLPERGALLVLDVQVDFMEEDGAFPVDAAQSESALRQINVLLQAQQDQLDLGRAGMPVVLTKNDFAPEDPANPFRGNSAIAGSAGAELDGRLLQIDAPLFSKQESDSFSNEAFDTWLRDEQITHLYLTGVYSDGCVYATALAAQQRGYQVTIVEDAVATATDERLEASFDSFVAEGFSLLTAEQALAALMPAP